MIELRSDTFTLPTAAMMSAIAEAPLGDDGYREDPTVLKLEKLAAAKLGKESACLMPSGTMANLASILAHCPQTGSLALVGDQSDIFVYEDKGLARWAGITYKSLPTEPGGLLRLADLEQAFEDARSLVPGIGLVCLENPHNLCGGVVLSPDYVRTVAELVHSRGSQLHLDGARIFNAAVKLGIHAAELVRDADSVQFCLSKGLSAPIGSMVAGKEAFIEQVRSRRTMLGGTMRQAGIFAAAGIVALETMVGRLNEDHLHARRLAEGLNRLSGIEVDLATVQTNTVVFRLTDKRFDSSTFIEAARRSGVGISDFKDGRLRAVTHSGITDEDITKALQIFSYILQYGSL